MHGSSGCLGCDNNRKLISAVDEPLKGQNFQAQTVTKPHLSEDFWTTSTFDMDNSAIQSQGSISSISTSNQTMNANGSGNGNIPSEFVNHGLLLWNQTRQHWVGNKKSEKRGQQLREPRLSLIEHQPMYCCCVLAVPFSLTCLQLLDTFWTVIFCCLAYFINVIISWLSSWNATYESLLGSNKAFAKAVPLAEMIDFLVDIWEQDGMYD